MFAYGTVSNYPIREPGADRLAAYLVVFLPPSKAPTALFPSDDPFSTDKENEYTANEVYTLKDVHAIPLVPERAKTHLTHLAGINVCFSSISTVRTDVTRPNVHPNHQRLSRHRAMEPGHRPRLEA